MYNCINNYDAKFVKLIDSIYSNIFLIIITIKVLLLKWRVRFLTIRDTE